MEGGEGEDCLDQGGRELEQVEGAEGGRRGLGGGFREEGLLVGFAADWQEGLDLARLFGWVNCFVVDAFAFYIVWLTTFQFNIVLYLFNFIFNLLLDHTLLNFHTFQSNLHFLLQLNNLLDHNLQILRTSGFHQNPR